MLGTRLLILFSQIVEGVAEDEKALRALVGHEIGHLLWGHGRWRWLLIGGAWIPFLYLWWSRLTEYTADRCGYFCAGNELGAAEHMLTILAVGWRLARQVQPEVWLQQAEEAEASVLAKAVELVSPHPPLVRRLVELRRFALGEEAVPVVRNIATTLAGILLAPLGVCFHFHNPLAFLGIIGILSILLAAMLPVFAQAREKAQVTACRSNLSQLGLALSMYVQDWDERFPPEGVEWEEALWPYVRNGEVFVCPSDRTPPEIEYSPFRVRNPSYQLNPNLRGLTVSHLPYAAEMVAIFESDDGTTVENRHIGGANYTFVDGHVKWLPAGREKEVKWGIK